MVPFLTAPRMYDSTKDNSSWSVSTSPIELTRDVASADDGSMPASLSAWFVTT